MKVGGIIFGGIFFLAGLAAFFLLILITLFDAFQMQSWQSTPAQLTRADISRYESRNDNGSYTTMYSVDMEYTYQAMGQTYIGTRSNLREDSSSDSNEHYQRLYKIKQEAAQNQLFVWVNPNEPSESIYDRNINFKFTLIMTMFTSVFMFVGVGIMYSSRNKTLPLPLGIKPDPNKPWTTRAEWASPKIFSNAKSKIGIIKFFTILSFLFFGMFSLALFGQHPIATVFAFVLLLPPLFLLYFYRKTKREWDHFDKVPMQLNPYPGVIGGKVGGSILIPERYTRGDHYTFELTCTHHWTSRSGNKSESHSSIIWSKSIKPTPKSKITGTYLDFAFEVPADKPSSSKPDNNYHNWTIKISSELKGINFNRAYDIPVFITQDSQTVEDELKQKPLTAQQKSQIHQRLSVNSIHQALDLTRNSNSEVSISNSPSNHTAKQSLSMRTPGSSAGWPIAGIGAVFFIIGIVIATVGQSFFGYAFSAMASLFIVLGVFSVGRNCQIRASHNLLEIDVYMFSRLVKQHKYSRENIKEIKSYKASSTSKNGKQSNEKYNLKLFTVSGKIIDLGGEFESMKNATHMQLEIEAVLAGSLQ